jgi:hypothetical protein
MRAKRPVEEPIEGLRSRKKTDRSHSVDHLKAQMLAGKTIDHQFADTFQYDTMMLIMQHM